MTAPGASCPHLGEVVRRLTSSRASSLVILVVLVVLVFLLTQRTNRGDYCLP